MEQAQVEETKEQVLRAAADAGFDLSIAQLHRWQRRGLVPRPRQVGLGRKRGTETRYPAGTADQVVSLCKRLAVNRSLDDAGWGLWWDGYLVAEALIRKLIEAELAYLTAIQKAFDRLGDLDGDDDWEQQLIGLLDEVGTSGRLDPVLAQMRRRIGKRRMPTFLRIAFSTAGGRVVELVDDDAEIVSKAYGVGLHPEEVAGQLQDVAEVLDPSRLREAYEAASWADLNTARDEIVRGLATISARLGVIQELLGFRIDPAQAEVIRKPTPDDASGLLLLWLSLRDQPDAKERFNELLGWTSDDAVQIRDE